MPVLILLSIWKQFQYGGVFGWIASHSTSRYEAAELDGADAWQQFWHITLPDYVLPSSLCNDHDCHFTLWSFEQVYVITGGGPLNSTNLLVYYIYEHFAQFDFGYAAAAATVLLAIALLLVYLQLRTWGEVRCRDGSIFWLASLLLQIQITPTCLNYHLRQQFR